MNANMKLHIYKDANELSQAVADWMVEYIAACLAENNRFTIALSGGSTPKLLHAILASPPYREKIDWNKMHIFWGDERAVPFDDERNNAKMAYDTLLNFVPVPSYQIHVMRTDIKPEDAAAEYDQILHRYFDETSTSFDLVLLGMGDDGHTLSLFPGTEIIHEKTRWTKTFFLNDQNMYRISLTAPIVNKSACIAFMVAGSGKSKTLQEVVNGNFQPEKYPSQMIKPVNGELHWFVDEAAAADLKIEGRLNL